MHFRGEFLYPYITRLGMVGLVGIASLAQSPHSLPAPNLGGDRLTPFCSKLPSTLTSCSLAGIPAPCRQVHVSPHMYILAQCLLWFSHLMKDSESLDNLQGLASSNPPFSEKLPGNPQRTFLLKVSGPLFSPGPAFWVLLFFPVASGSP